MATGLQYVSSGLGHSTRECFTLRRKYQQKVMSGETEISQPKNIRKQALLNHKGKSEASCNMVTTSGFDEMMAEFQEMPTTLEETPIPELQVKTLLESEKFKLFFDQIQLNGATRQEATKALIKISEN